jgi:hypothetical protein
VDAVLMVMLLPILHLVGGRKGTGGRYARRIPIDDTTSNSDDRHVPIDTVTSKEGDAGIPTEDNTNTTTFSGL